MSICQKKKSKYVQHVHKRGTEKLWVLELNGTEERAEQSLFSGVSTWNSSTHPGPVNNGNPLVSKTGAKLDGCSGDWPDSSQVVSWKSRNGGGNLGWVRRDHGIQDRGLCSHCYTTPESPKPFLVSWEQKVWCGQEPRKWRKRNEVPEF